ncbi:MAG: hypothetical protein EKK40_16660 [Bradyrhizobiaceae bacterium]|nr:MAG: hypothetical protein EKK40_16660 [Bradyrhizobiaceae bacterium]
MSRKDLPTDANLFSRASAADLYGSAGSPTPWEIISDIRSRINQEQMDRRRRDMIVNLNLIILMLFALVVGGVALFVSWLSPV